MTTPLDVTDQTVTATRAALAFSLVSLFLSGAAVVAAAVDGDFERDTEQRLACLELPGPNDCGADGR